MLHTSMARSAFATPIFLLVALFIQFSLSGQVWINEFHYDNASTDVGEFVEIAGPAGTSLTGFSVVFYNQNGTVYETLTLSGTLPDQSNGFGTLSFLQAGIQNGPSDGFALVAPANMVIEFLSYEGTTTAMAGPASGMTSVDVGVSEPNSTPIGQSLQLKGTGAQSSDFTWAAPSAESPGAINAGQTFSAPNPPVATIGATGYPTLKAAVDAAVDGNTVTLIANSSESAQINVDVSITIDGGGFTLTPAAGNSDRGFEITAPNVIIQDLNMQGFTGNAIHTGIGADGLTIQRVSISGNGSSAIAPACIDNVTFTDITVMGTTGGAGLSIASVSNLTVTNYTSSGNGFSPAFQVSIGVFGASSDCTAQSGNGVLSSSNITFTGVLNISEPVVYYTGGGSAVGNPPIVTFDPSNEITQAGRPIITNAEGYLLFYAPDAASAFSGLAAFAPGNARLAGLAVITDTADDDKRLVAADITIDGGQTTYDMSIQSAINSILTGEPTDVEIRGGDYPENVDFSTKDVTIKIGIE